MRPIHPRYREPPLQQKNNFKSNLKKGCDRKEQRLVRYSVGKLIQAMSQLDFIELLYLEKNREKRVNIIRKRASAEIYCSPSVTLRLSSLHTDKEREGEFACS